MSERITIHTIETKEFSIKQRGYDQNEVDVFLDEICDELERLNNEIASLRSQLRDAQAAAARPAPRPAQPAPAAVPAPVSTVLRPVQPAPQPETKSPAQPAPQADSNAELFSILEMATRVRNETIAEAKKQAELIVSEAEEKAKEQLGSLSEERDTLTQKVEALRKSAADYRTRFADLLKAQQEALDKIDDL